MYQRSLMPCLLLGGMTPSVQSVISPSRTSFHLRKHMDVHWGEQFPCGNCNKLLASHWMLRDQEKGCIQGTRYPHDQCDKDYATKHGLRQHTRAVHGLDRPAQDEVFWCPHCAKAYKVKKSSKGACDHLQPESCQE